MKPEHAAHLQNIQDADIESGGDGGDEDLCKRSDCWELDAGVVACWVFQEGSEHEGRCRVCDHLPECHMPEDEGKRREAEFLSDFGLQPEVEQ